ncbi:hypothetical protein U1Q18_001197 [Sarracenia purpurea var. burkii]
MAPSSSWLRSLLSAKNWFAAPSMEVLSTRLREYGFAWGGFTKTREVIVDQATNSLLKEIYVQEEENNLRTKPLPNLQEVEEIIGYHFNNRDLLEEAFTHVSYQKKCLSYERLEYVGDSVLNFLITKEQVFLYSNLPPGLLSPLRAANVDTEKLARVAVKRKLYKYLRHRQPMLSKQVLSDAPKVLADIVEATIGAIFIDSNSSIDTTWEVAKGLLQPIITPEMVQMHPVQKLYETCQKNGFRVRLVDLWLKEGAYEVIVDNRLRGRGMCRAKKEIALNRAANNAYNEIVRKLGVKHDINTGG